MLLFSSVRPHDPDSIQWHLQHYYTIHDFMDHNLIMFSSHIMLEQGRIKHINYIACLPAYLSLCQLARLTAKRVLYL